MAKGFDYFDDCTICQATKEAEEKGKSLTESELKQAFKKAKKKSADEKSN